MKRFILTPRAKQDVSDIWDYIADDSIYRHEMKPLQVIRVLHAARHVQSILGLSPDEL
jgi:plasmid stabilization system protein ParE